MLFDRAMPYAIERELPLASAIVPGALDGAWGRTESFWPRDPAVVPDAVAQFSCLVDGLRHPSFWQHGELPAELRAATPQRQLQFLAGRFCASQALAALTGRRAPSLPRAATGAPLWPQGITGSITHTDDFASAAVTWTDSFSSVGIDTERIMTAERAARVSPAVAWPSELAHARSAGCDRLQAVTLVFSAKESIFKCLHRHVGRVFDFCDVRIVAVDPAARSFTARVVKTLAERFPAQTLLEGRFDIEEPWIHTGMVLR